MKGGSSLAIREKRVAGFARQMRANPTTTEALMKASLKQLSAYSWRCQHRIEAKYILDFFCLSGRVAIEVDGVQHETKIGRAKDAARDAYVLREHGIKTLRIANRHARSLRQRRAFIKRVDYEIDCRRWFFSRMR